jgi:tetratricopeptide (TPR) repeat protein
MREEKKKNIRRAAILPFKPMRMFLWVIALAVIFMVSAPMPAQAFVFQERISMSKSLSHYAMGYMYDLLGMTTNAVFEYEKALQFDEASYKIHLKLGTDYARLDMLKDAVSELELVKKYNQDNLQARYLLALIYSDQKDYTEAAQEYEYILNQFSEAEPQNMEIYGYLGQLYYSQRKYDKAIEQFENILSLDPDNPDIMYLLGSLYLEVKEEDKSIDILKKSLAIDPKHDGSLNTLAYVYAEQGKHLDKALELVNRALALLPTSGAYLDSKGWIFYKKGEYDKALTYLLKANEVLEDPVVYSHLGDVYFALGKKEEAIRYWKLSLDLQPEQSDLKDKIQQAESSQAKQSEE